MILFGVDFGDTRTGWAVCDKSEMIASPAGVLTERCFAVCAEKTAEAAVNAKAEEIVVGHPINMNGTRGPRAEKCAAFAEKLRELTSLPVTLWDERCTTVSAHQILNTTNTRGKKRKGVVDAVAAVLILESYMGFRKNRPAAPAE
ncbi:MAG: Holliday junction resolvase RuvX [Oscillospiraceae bacterium]|nr:Holliday junction resolvase RuvX [Oscillospiraceae bacterium]